MFAEHQPVIEASARSGPEGLERVCQFTLATIRAGLLQVREDMPRIYAGERPPRTIFGSKLRGLGWLAVEKRTLYRRAEYLARLPACPLTDTALVSLFTRIPGIGAVKAGFIVQLAFGRVGCLDTWNLQRFGLPPAAFEAHGRRYERLAARYVQVCGRCGTPGELWDDWCEQAAARYGLTAEEVSAAHLVACLPEHLPNRIVLGDEIPF